MDKIYTYEMTKEDFTGSNGLELSLRKWRSFLKALLSIAGEMIKLCGLCFESFDENGDRDCEECRFQESFGYCLKCTPYIDAERQLYATIDAIRAMISLLEGMK